MGTVGFRGEIAFAVGTSGAVNRAWIVVFADEFAWACLAGSVGALVADTALVPVFAIANERCVKTALVLLGAGIIGALVAIIAIQRFALCAVLRQADIVLCAIVIVITGQCIGKCRVAAGICFATQDAARRNRATTAQFYERSAGAGALTGDESPSVAMLDHAVKTVAHYVLVVKTAQKISP